MRAWHCTWLLWWCGCAASLPAAEHEQRLTTEQMLEVAAVLASTGESVRAEQYLRDALEQGADPRKVVPRLLRLYAHDGQYRLAIELAEETLRRRPGDQSLRLLLAALYTAVDAHAQAAEAYRAALAREPRNADAHFALGSLLYDAGTEPARADEHLRTYLALAPHGEHADEARSLLLTELP